MDRWVRAWKALTPLARVFLAAVALLLVLVLANAAGLTDGGTRSGSSSAPYADIQEKYGGEPAVYRRIAGISDCVALQAELETASENYDRTSDRHSIGYMEAADRRLEAAGCY